MFKVNTRNSFLQKRLKPLLKSVSDFSFIIILPSRVLLIFTIISTYGFVTTVSAQEDSRIILEEPIAPPTTIINDSLIISDDAQVEIVKTDQSHSPRKASLYSAVLPGLGQAYNGKYWKIPILYAGLGTLVYSINFNHRTLIDYTEAYYALLHTDNPEAFRFKNQRVTPEVLNRGIEEYRRTRDYLIIISGIVYFLNIADALVDAHLNYFDMGEGLSLKIRPTGGQFQNNVNYAGLAITLNF